MGNVLMQVLVDNLKIKLLKSDLQIDTNDLLNKSYYLDESSTLYLYLNKGLYSIKDLSYGFKLVIGIDCAYLLKLTKNSEVKFIEKILLPVYYVANNVGNVFLNLLFNNKLNNKKLKKTLITHFLSRKEVNGKVFRFGKNTLYLTGSFRFLLKLGNKKVTGNIQTFDFNENLTIKL